VNNDTVEGDNSPYTLKIRLILIIMRILIDCSYGYAVNKEKEEKIAVNSSHTNDDLAHIIDMYIVIMTLLIILLYS